MLPIIHEYLTLTFVINQPTIAKSLVFSRLKAYELNNPTRLLSSANYSFTFMWAV